MGFGFPAAIGACFANPGRPVFAICGDGGFQMTMPELATVKRYQVPVKIVLIDNRNLGMVRQWQELFYDERYSATNLSDNPDFAAIAAAYGIRSETVDAPDDLDAAIQRLIAIPGPALLHCACYPAENVWPMIPGGGSIDDVMTERAPIPA
jgi:acetolactate synthase-1/2/3 large subunit